MTGNLSPFGPAHSAGRLDVLAICLTQCTALYCPSQAGNGVKEKSMGTGGSLYTMPC
jgi:hypothetical protein